MFIDIIQYVVNLTVLTKYIAFLIFVCSKCEPFEWLCTVWQKLIEPKKRYDFWIDQSPLVYLFQAKKIVTLFWSLLIFVTRYDAIIGLAKRYDFTKLATYMIVWNLSLTTISLDNLWIQLDIHHSGQLLWKIILENLYDQIVFKF